METGVADSQKTLSLVRVLFIRESSYLQKVEQKYY